jgi:hypothetical protein
MHSIAATNPLAGSIDRLSAIYASRPPAAAASSTAQTSVAPLAGTGDSLTGQATPGTAASSGDSSGSASSAATPLDSSSGLATPFQQLQSTLQALLLQVQALMGAPPGNATAAASAATGPSSAGSSSDVMRGPSLGELRNDVNDLMAELSNARRVSRQQAANDDFGTVSAQPNAPAALFQNAMQAVGTYSAVAKASETSRVPPNAVVA